MDLDLIVPSFSQDISRLAILVASLRKFWHINGRRVLAVPRHELSLFRQFEPYMELIPKDEVIGKQPYEEQVPGWYRQQMVKIGMGLQFNGAYIALDSDCFAAKHLDSSEFFKDRKLPWIEGHESHGQGPYYRGSADALDIDELPENIWSWRPPFFFQSEVIASLVQRLQERELGWVDVLCRTRSWAEICLYHLEAVRTGAFQNMYYKAECLTHKPIVFPYVAVDEDFRAWDVNETFSGKYAFGVIHSNTLVDPKQTEVKLKGKF